MEIPEGHDASIALVGIPFDAHSSFLQGTANGPAEIRKSLKSDSSNMNTESVFDLGNSNKWIDVGDIKVDDYHHDIEAGIGELINSGLRPVSLGGDHSVSYPVIKAIAQKYPQLSILHLDAHGDLYDEFEGNKYSHACPFARVMEENLASRLVQVGIRTLTPHQKSQAERFEVEVIEMKDFTPDLKLEFDHPVYLSVDLDVLDPAFAPGLSHYEPGGLSTRDVINIIQRLNCPLVGADIVELNPSRDVHGVTGMVAAKILKEIMGQMIDHQV